MILTENMTDSNLYVLLDTGRGLVDVNYDGFFHFEASIRCCIIRISRIPGSHGCMTTKP